MTEPDRLNDPARLRALQCTGLLDSPAEPMFDRLATLVALALDVPTATVTLVDDRRQFFKAASGLDEPMATERETPLELSFCRTVVDRDAPLVVPNAHDDDDFRDHAAVDAAGVIAYAGMPIRDPDGVVLGSLCAIDVKPRRWTTQQLAILEHLADTASELVALRLRIADLEPGT